MREIRDILFWGWVLTPQEYIKSILSYYITEWNMALASQKEV